MRLWKCVCMVWCMTAGVQCVISTPSQESLTCTAGEQERGRICGPDGYWVISDGPPQDMEQDQHDMPADLVVVPDLSCVPIPPVCDASRCDEQATGYPDGCGGEVAMKCTCAPDMVCDEGFCRDSSACALTTVARKAACISGARCTQIETMDECMNTVTVDCGLVCDEGALCVSEACCQPKRADEAGDVEVLCNKLSGEERCEMVQDVDLGCGVFAPVDCGPCRDSRASCNEGVCEAPMCPSGATCGFVEGVGGVRIPCGVLAGACGAGELCDDYTCVTSLFVSPPASANITPSFFGHAVAFSGEWLVVGAPLLGEGSGGAHLYRRNASSLAMEYVSTLTSPSNMTKEFFGASVAMDGDWIAVGAPGVLRVGDMRSVGAIAEGNVYMFERSAGVWSAQGVALDRGAIGLPTGHVLGAFGFDVALDGETLVVGSPLRSIKNVEDEVGGAFVYERSAQGVLWGSAVELPYDEPEDLRLGYDVDILGDRIAAGAPELPGRFGGVYNWQRTAPGVWGAPLILRPGDGSGTMFGYATALNQTHIYVGEPNKPAGVGQVIVARAHNGASPGSAFNALTLSNSGYFGSAIAVDDATIVVGMPAYAFYFSGSATTMSVESNVFIHQLAANGSAGATSRGFPSLPDANMRFTGFSLDVADGYVIVSSPHQMTDAESRVYMLRGF